MPAEIYGSQTPREIAEAIVSHSGKFAETSQETAREAVIVVRHLTKQFGQRIAFEDVSFSVQRGEVFGFLGPNGAGKTSTVRTLSTLVSPTSGTAEVAGLPLDGHHDIEIRHRISVMTEVPGLYLRLSVTENLAFFAGLYGFRDAQPRIDRALEAVNLSSTGRRPVRQSLQGTSSARGTGPGAPERSGDHLPRRANGGTRSPSRRSRSTI